MSIGKERENAKKALLEFLINSVIVPMVVSAVASYIVSAVIAYFRTTK